MIHLRCNIFILLFSENIHWGLQYINDLTIELDKSKLRRNPELKPSLIIIREGKQYCSWIYIYVYKL